MADKQLIVSAPCVIARDDTGHDLYLYAGTPVPGNVPAEEVKRLQALGVLAKGEQTSNGDAEVQTPRKSAPAGDWTAYAIAQGMDAERAAKATKADLVAHYLDGGPLPGDSTEPPTDPEAPTPGKVDGEVDGSAPPAE